MLVKTLVSAALAIASAVITTSHAHSSDERLLNRVVGQAPNGPARVSNDGNPCIAALLVGWGSGMSIGCEDAAPATVQERAGTRESADLIGLSVKEACDRLVALNPGYAWSLRRDVIVVRPRQARDTDHPLDRPVKAISLRGTEGLASLHDLIVELFGGVKLRGAARGTVDQRAFTLDFPGGRFIDLLNAMATAYGSELSWHAMYHAPESPGKALDGEIYLELVLPSGGGVGAVIPHRQRTVVP